MLFKYTELLDCVFFKLLEFFEEIYVCVFKFYLLVFIWVIVITKELWAGG